MPAQERLGSDEERWPASPREQATEAREQSPICVRELGSADLALEDRQLVTEDDKLDVLRPLRAQGQDNEIEEAAERPVEKGESHVADPAPLR